MDAQTHLVADHDRGRGARCKLVSKQRDVPFDGAGCGCGEYQVGDEQGDAVDDDEIVRRQGACVVG